MIAGRLSIGLGLPVLARAGVGTLRGMQAARDMVQLFEAAACSSGPASSCSLRWSSAALRSGLHAQLLPTSPGLPPLPPLRLQKTGPVTVLLAAGRSRDILAGNSARLVGLAHRHHWHDGDAGPHHLLALQQRAKQ
jgi:hypothetical protein